MLENIEWLGHSTIKIKNDKKIIYIDPYKLKDSSKKADIIFITHSHYDHFSKNDIRSIKSVNTKIIIPIDIYQDVLDIGFTKDNILVINPNNTYKIDNITFSTIPAYNTNKKFHLKESNWVGYIIELNNARYYIAGDTDITDESKRIKCDVAFLPIGGTYTMSFDEAATLANTINPKVVVPIHYGSIVGTKEDAVRFKELLNDEIDCKIM